MLQIKMNENRINTQILDTLKEHFGQYVSGEALSERLGVSRTAIWKAVGELRSGGYAITASTKKGYCLAQRSDVLSMAEFQHIDQNRRIGRRLEFFNTIDSTNTKAKELAMEGCEDGTVVLADAQTAGRGRLGRSWASATGKGIWMSVVLRPSIPPEEVRLMTLAASAAVVEALERAVGVCAGIKWPNDILLDGKKVCGILTEMNSEMDRVNYLVLGIGINVSHEQEDFPEELQETATSLLLHSRKHVPGDEKAGSHGTLLRSDIVRALLESLEERYGDILEKRSSEILRIWKSYSVTLGRDVSILTKDSGFTGRAVDITGDGKLVLALPDGSVREVQSGEVSVRGLMGYV